ncbi:MAG: DNA methyltransferase [Rhodospirillales bacterium]|nr:DNA methyltransferase [Rhodospirillales bacterium]
MVLDTPHWAGTPPQAGRYAVIYADPPWHFATWSGKGEGRSATAHYGCMSQRDLAALPVASWAAPDAALLMWTTDTHLPRALDLIEAWGFTYKTVGFTWAKLNRSATGRGSYTDRDFFTGMGYWTRANPEQCLLATRGKPQRQGRDVRQLVVAPRREHSRKPDEVYDRIERLIDGPYLEMFARQTRPGWDAWGDEAGMFDGGRAETRRWPSNLKRHPDSIAAR